MVCVSSGRRLGVGFGRDLQLTDPDRGFRSLVLPYDRKTDSPRFAVSRNAGRVVVAGNVR